MADPQRQCDVLFLTQILPYPLAGGAKIRAYFMLRQLALAHKVTLVSFVREDDSPDSIAHLEQYCEAVYTVPIERSRLKDLRSLIESVIRQQPMIIARDRLPQMEAALRQLLTREQFHVIHADQTSMAQYALYAREVSAKGQRPRILLDQHNALYLVVERQAAHERGFLKRWLWRRESRLLARYETSLLRNFDEILAVTATDRDALLLLLEKSERVERSKHMSVVPICVDPGSQPLLNRHVSRPQIIHLGTMFWPPNIEGVLWFAENILPLIIREVPDVSFVIAGKNPPDEIEALAEPHSPIHGHVKVTGFVADPEPLLASSQVFVVPLLAGGGMRVKILDGWQWGLPIVSTTIGAEGIKLRDGDNILLADDPETFALAVVRILTDQELAARLRDNGRNWVEKQYNWHKVYRIVEDIYRSFGSGC